MHPPLRDQADIGAIDQLLDASHREGNKDMAHQEFKDEADINYMLSRFNVTQPRGTPTYGEWDDTLDLQVAIQATRDAKSAWLDLPEDLRNRFGRMEDLLTAIENGSIEIKNEEFKDPLAQPPTT